VTTVLEPQVSESRVERAERLDREIVAGIRAIRMAWVLLAEFVYQFHDERGWETLGYETLNAYLAEPHRDIKRRQFFRLVELHREFVIERGVSPLVLAEIDVSRMIELLPAIRDGNVSVDELLETARTCTSRELRRRYSTGGELRRKPKRCFGPSVLAEEFRHVVVAHRDGDKVALCHSLRELADIATRWAEQVNGGANG
jgi:hypothetical protein